MPQTRKWISSAVGIAAALLFLASLAAAQAKPTETQPLTKKSPVKSEAQCRPANPVGKGTCQAQIECPPIKNPGKTTCQVTIDCPPAKAKEKK
jgi:hypothetical protein